MWVEFKMAAIRGMSLKNVVKIHGAYCSFDPKTATIREFLRRVNAKSVVDTNTKCKISKEVKNDNSNPFMEITYVDKEVQVFHTENLKLMDLIKQFNLRCKTKEK